MKKTFFYFSLLTFAFLTQVACKKSSNMPTSAPLVGTYKGTYSEGGSAFDTAAKVILTPGEATNAITVTFNIRNRNFVFSNQPITSTNNFTINSTQDLGTIGSSTKTTANGSISNGNLSLGGDYQRSVTGTPISSFTFSGVKQ